MKIAIHHTRGSFSDGWIQYCEENNIDYKLVNYFDQNGAFNQTMPTIRTLDIVGFKTVAGKTELKLSRPNIARTLSPSLLKERLTISNFGE